MTAMEWQLDLELPPQPRTHVQQSFRSLYLLDGAGGDLTLHLHPNGLCLVALAPSHAALQHRAAWRRRQLRRLRRQGKQSQRQE